MADRVQVVRPFGDNGKEARELVTERPSPVPWNTSSIGDCLKLAASAGNERKAIVVFGYEHNPSSDFTDPCIDGFEMLARRLLGITLSPRIERRIDNLIHPVHKSCASLLGKF